MKPCHYAAIFVALTFVFTVAFEVWAHDTGHETISQWVWRMEDRNPLVRWIGLGLLAALAWHLFGPDWW